MISAPLLHLGKSLKKIVYNLFVTNNIVTVNSRSSHVRFDRKNSCTVLTKFKIAATVKQVTGRFHAYCSPLACMELMSHLGDSEFKYLPVVVDGLGGGFSDG